MMTIDWEVMMLYDDHRLTSYDATCWWYINKSLPNKITIDWQVKAQYYDRLTSESTVWRR